MYEGPDDNDYNDPNDFVSNSQYMFLGAILGVIATLIYYQIVKIIRRCRNKDEIADIEN